MEKVNRIVYGDFRSHIVTIPETTLPLLSTIFHNGGKRVGAGRPRTRNTQPIDGVGGEKSSEPILGDRFEEVESFQEVGTSLPQNPAETISRATQNSFLIHTLIRVEPEARCADGVISDSEKKPNTPGSKKNEVEVPQPKKSPEWKKRFTLGQPPPSEQQIKRSEVEGVRRKKRFELICKDSLVPPFPSTELIGVGTYPAPPTIPETATPSDGADILARYFIAGVEHKFKEPYWGFKNGIRSSQYFKQLCDATKALQEHNIAPVKWIAFSLDNWIQIQTDDGRKRKSIKAPPVDWVFSLRRINDQVSWFKREAGAYAFTGQTMMSIAHRKFSMSYQSMDAELRRLADSRDWQSQEEVREATIPVVEKHFPNGWRNLMEALMEEAENYKKDALEMISNCEWVWR